METVLQPRDEQWRYVLLEPEQIKRIFASDELIFHIVKSQKVSFAYVPFNVFAHYCSVDKDRC